MGNIRKSGKKWLRCMLLLLCLCFLTGAGTGAEAASVSKTLTKNVNQVLKKQVKTKDSKKTKLKKLFKYLEKEYGYARKIGFKNTKDWAKEYAVEMFQKKRGSCYHFAAVYAFLAKKATNYPVRIGIGWTKGFGNANQPHAWTEIKIKNKWYICDPNMDKFAAKSKLKYFLKSRNNQQIKKTYYNFKKTTYVTVKF